MYICFYFFIVLDVIDDNCTSAKNPIKIESNNTILKFNIKTVQTNDRNKIIYIYILINVLANHLLFINKYIFSQYIRYNNMPNYYQIIMHGLIIKLYITILYTIFLFYSR